MHDRQRASGASLDPYPQSSLSVFRAAVPKSTPQGRAADGSDMRSLWRTHTTACKHGIDGLHSGCTTASARQDLLWTHIRNRHFLFSVLPSLNRLPRGEQPKIATSSLSPKSSNAPSSEQHILYGCTGFTACPSAITPQLLYGSFVFTSTIPALYSTRTVLYSVFRRSSRGAEHGG